MTRDKIDQLWGQALVQSVHAGEIFTRYHFAALVLEEAARVCDEAYSRSAGAAERTKSSREITIYQTAASRSEYLAQAIRAMKPEVK